MYISDINKKTFIDTKKSKYVSNFTSVTFFLKINKLYNRNKPMEIKENVCNLKKKKIQCKHQNLKKHLL